MLNEDLIAYLQPSPSRGAPHEWHDACQHVRLVRATPHRLEIHLSLKPGLYKGRIETRPGAFEMESAMVEMTRVPDGKAVALGPWDLNHIDEVMALPMALVRVNGQLLGGLWFNVPSPEQIEQGMLTADFGFEALGQETELVFELTERDRARLSWNAMAFVDLRHDDRRRVPLQPQATARPRIHQDGGKEGREQLRNEAAFQETAERVKAFLDTSGDCDAGPELPLNEDHWDGFDAACLVAHVSRDAAIVSGLKAMLLALCRRESWSGRPDPLIMGGDNDRTIGHKLYMAGIGWEFLRPWLDEGERATVRSKVGEYLQKLYRFTLLQRGYMGCPNPGAHSLGTWYGVGVACMAFYDELPEAPRILSFFHGLFLDSLTLFPESGKARWVATYPLWPVRYFAAAATFGGPIPELGESPYLRHLGEALSASFLAPNSQEMQRGPRTVVHRLLTAFLHRFVPSPETASLYAAFVEEERRATGRVEWGLFDLLYAPAILPPPARFPVEPFYAAGIGELITLFGGERKMTTLINGGVQAGAGIAFRIMPHNREAWRAMGDLTIRINETPVVVAIQGSYGLFSANRNVLCFEEGCGVAEGRQLHGEMGAQYNAHVRRCRVGSRFVYIDINFTRSLDPSLGVLHAQRTVLQDRLSGAVVVEDFFESRVPLRFSTHLHCPGSIDPLSDRLWRLTGGQANRIAGIKHGDAGLNDDEGEALFVRLLESSHPQEVRIFEPSWFPSYIYGINGRAGQRLEEARYPRIQRWMLAAREPAASGRFLFSLALDGEAVTLRDGAVQLAGNARYYPAGGAEVPFEGGCCRADAVVIDEDRGEWLGFGVQSFSLEGMELEFADQVDLAIRRSEGSCSGTVYAPSADPLRRACGVEIGPFRRSVDRTRSFTGWEASFTACRPCCSRAAG
ncbi:MAG TPA: hypothetical protein VNQ90_16350 [Chthoniobacteraceae bacterium]|nr:hypothetical protein [Chthoniobacteraceae bacterium]